MGEVFAKDWLWTDAQKLQLQKAAAAGLSASVIASHMGLTRAAVIGKCYRMKLKLRGGEHAPTDQYMKRILKVTLPAVGATRNVLNSKKAAK